MTKADKRNFKVLIEYDGTDFAGWQVQPEERTVQGTIEETLARLTGETARVIGSGRTDAGVHARGQAAHFFSSTQLAGDALLKGMNALLPKDAAILELKEVSADFHARFSAQKKTYCYSVWTEKIRSPLHWRTTFHYPYGLSLEKMRKAAESLIGAHDFATFASNRGKPEHSTVRSLTRFEIVCTGGLLQFILEADGFLYKMVRGLVGTVMEVGRGKIDQREFEDIFMKADRTCGGPNLPPQGLCLERVVY